MKNRDARNETSAEVEQIKKIINDTNRLKSFWNRRYIDTYNSVLDSINEFGRHGIICEYLLRIVKKGKILDVGCGTGILYELINSKNFIYKGIDISDIAISNAKKKFKTKSHEFDVTRFEDYNPTEKFDAIILNEAIYYMDENFAIEKCRELLAEQGHLIISIFDFKEGLEILAFILNQFDQPIQLKVENPHKNFKWNIIAGKLINS